MTSFSHYINIYLRSQPFWIYPKSSHRILFVFILIFDPTCPIGLRDVRGMAVPSDISRLPFYRNFWVMVIYWHIQRESLTFLLLSNSVSFSVHILLCIISLHGACESQWNISVQCAAPRTFSKNPNRIGIYHLHFMIYYISRLCQRKGESGSC